MPFVHAHRRPEILSAYLMSESFSCRNACLARQSRLASSRRAWIALSSAAKAGESVMSCV
eukprot:7383421-Prymnesium_polylepis.1